QVPQQTSAAATSDWPIPQVDEARAPLRVDQQPTLPPQVAAPSQPAVPSQVVSAPITPAVSVPLVATSPQARGKSRILAAALEWVAPGLGIMYAGVSGWAR